MTLDEKKQTILIGHGTIKNAEKFKEYGLAAGPTLAQFGGELLFKGSVDKVLIGEHQHAMVAIIKFPCKDSLNNWYCSDAYQATIPIREEGADITFISYEEPMLIPST